MLPPPGNFFKRHPEEKAHILGPNFTWQNFFRIIDKNNDGQFDHDEFTNAVVAVYHDSSYTGALGGDQGGSGDGGDGDAKVSDDTTEEKGNEEDGVVVQEEIVYQGEGSFDIRPDMDESIPILATAMLSLGIATLGGGLGIAEMKFPLQMVMRRPAMTEFD